MPEERELLVKRFKREFDCGQIESPYLVHSLGYGSVSNNPYIVMDFCSGGSLSNKGDLPFDKIDRYAAEVLQGLEALHRGGVVHRDMKPENILLSNTDTACITDFGIAGFGNARMTKRNIFGQANALFGTYAYMPPEQLNAKLSFKSMSPSTDMFAFGATFFEIIAGRLPFGKLDSESDLGQYVLRSNKGQWDDLRSVRNGVPEHWVKVMKACLTPDYKQRAQSAREVLQLLGYQARKQSTYDFRRDILCLKVMNGDEAGRLYPLNTLLKPGRQTLTLGWLDAGNPGNNDLGILEKNTSYISSYHATIQRDEQQGCWLLRDGQQRVKGGINAWYPSTNGTWINSRELGTETAVLQPDDIVTVGDTTLKVTVQPGQA